MIVVGAFNPAIDRLIDVDALVPGAVLRARAAAAAPGGKGVHVALAAAALGEPVALVAPLDAAHEERFAHDLGPRAVELHAVPVASPPRTCLALRDAAGVVTEVLEPGPALAGAEAEALRARFLELAARASVAVLTGSLPRGMPDDTYASLVEALRARGVRAVVDASGEALRLAAGARPFALKPNRDEARALLGAGVDGVAAARALAGRGIELPVVSLGAAGAVVAWQGRIARVEPPGVDAVNAVGAGDCLAGGLAVALARGLAIEEALRLAVACGTAAALTAETGALRPGDVEALAPRVAVRWNPGDERG